MISIAGEKDAKKIWKIISKEFAYKKFTPEIIAQRINRDNFVTLKKTIGKKLVGFAEIELKEDHAMINAIGIEKEFRKRGYGSELLDTAIEYIDTTGYNSAVLLVKKGNMNAKRLYTAKGFEYAGMHNSKIEGIDVEVWSKKIFSHENYAN